MHIIICIFNIYLLIIIMKCFVLPIVLVEENRDAEYFFCIIIIIGDDENMFCNDDNVIFKTNS